jgi:MSHA biogenesis protein MshJ
LKQSWLLISSKFEALNKRERWMVTCALLTVVYALINMALLSPVLARQKTLTDDIEADQSQIQALNLQISEFAKQNVVDPDAQNKQRIAELESHLQLLETKLSGLQSTLISPDKMPELLLTLLKKNVALKLIELKTLPTTGLIDKSTKGTDTVTATSSSAEQDTTYIEKPSKQDLPVFKHGVEITIEGRYLDLLAYVADLEKMPWHVLWSKADLNTKNYPYSQLKLTVYTLSLDQTWLSI